uniref:Uncharacterized protein n=1 Tax=Arundo donax TaxID=35708 RepID=A0A0A9DFJ9_ARUDO
MLLPGLASLPALYHGRPRSPARSPSPSPFPSPALLVWSMPGLG